jgi:glutathione synthase/RimK-type ligase-like ATP-grasp enzyme
MLLIVTNKQDMHADEVIRCLHRMSVPVFRLNTEDLLTKYFFVLTLSHEDNFQGSITDELGRVLNFDSLRVAWYRKPNLDFFGDPVAMNDTQHFIAAEARSFLDVLYSLPQITWINNPSAASKSKSKIQQLLLASRLGVRIPQSLITNMPAPASIFFEKCGEVVLAKGLYSPRATINGMLQGIPSRRIEHTQFRSNLSSVAYAPTHLQEYVPKEFELRITVVGGKVFAARIDSQLHEETRIDWRQRADLCPHSPHTLPDDIRDFCITFIAEQGLLYGAMDFIVTPRGEYVFLENNPYGQYLWVEQMTGLPITQALCDLFEKFLN